jgi:hypothetical protein
MCVAALMCSAFSGAAIAQALPWQTPQAQPAPQYAPSQYPPAQYPAQNPPQYPSQNPAQGTHHHKQGNITGKQSPRAATPAMGARTQDDRELNNLATKFYHISAKDPKAISKLKALEGKVRTYREGLSSHGYDATDITSDAQKLQNRIAHQRKSLEAKAAAAEQQPATTAPVKVIAPSEAIAPAAPR